MYRADRSIVKQLRELDPDLGVRWDRDSERWVVTCQGKDAVVVRNDDNTYRPLDGRIVARMRKEAWEYRSYFGAFHLLDREVHIRNHERQRQREAAERDNFRQYAIEEIYPRVVGVGGAEGRNKFAGWSAA